VKYVSIDIETTGLKAEKNQMVEFGAVVEDLAAERQPVVELPSFRAIIIDPEGEYRISPFVMRMHTALFEEIGKCKSDKLEKEGWYQHDDSTAQHVVLVCYPKVLVHRFLQWLRRHDCFTGKGKVIAAGKNFYGFDYNFIKPLFDCGIKFHHRSLDPVMYYIKPTDRKPPDLQLCCERANLPMSDYHTAIGDARMVIELIRIGMERSGL